MEIPAPAAAPPGPGIAAKPWGIPAVLLALLLPVALWGSSLGIAIVEGTPEELSAGEVVTGLVFTIVLDFVLIGLAVGLSLWRYRLSWAELGLRRLDRNILLDLVLIGFGALLAVVNWFLRSESSPARELSHRWFDRNFWRLPLGAAAGAHIGIIVYSVVLIALGAEAAVPEQEDLDQLFESRAVLPLSGVATVLMAPLAEEIFFRGFIFPGLLRRFGVGGAMVASGLLFGAFHITGPETVGLVLPFGVIGMLFAWVYYRTGSLWPSIATHLLFNLVSFALLASLAGYVSG